jgi:hypothetical protein
LSAVQQLPQDWLAKVLDNSGNPVGLGVLVEPKHVVTCAHVVNRALGLGPDEEPSAEARVAVRTLVGRDSCGHVRLWRAPDEVPAT